MSSYRSSHSKRVNISLPNWVLKRIDVFIKQHRFEYPTRSEFIMKAALSATNKKCEGCGKLVSGGVEVYCSSCVISLTRGGNK